MAVRVYDISKKLGVEPKLVISEAKKLGIEAAKRLEAELRKLYPYMPSKKAELN